MMGENDENGDGKLNMEEWLKYVKGIFDKKESSCQAILKLYEKQINQNQEMKLASTELKVWNVTLEKATDGTVGLDVVEKESKFLKVKKEVKEDGLVGEWNKSNPDKAIQLGDFIIEVNGVKEDSAQMLSEIKAQTKLSLTIKRGATASDGI